MCKTASREACAPVVAKRAALRGVSAISLGRALGFKILPVVFGASFVVSAPGYQLGAMEGERGKPHVRVLLSGPATGHGLLAASYQLSAFKGEGGKPHLRVLLSEPATDPSPRAVMSSNDATPPTHPRAQASQAHAQVFALPAFDEALAGGRATFGLIVAGMGELGYFAKSHSDRLYSTPWLQEATSNSNKRPYLADPIVALVQLKPESAPEVIETATVPSGAAGIVTPMSMASVRRPHHVAAGAAPVLEYGPLPLDIIPGSTEILSGFAKDDPAAEKPASVSRPTASEYATALIEMAGGYGAAGRVQQELPIPPAMSGLVEVSALRPEDFGFAKVLIEQDDFPQVGPGGFQTEMSEIVAVEGIRGTTTASELQEVWLLHPDDLLTVDDGAGQIKFSADDGEFAGQGSSEPFEVKLAQLLEPAEVSSEQTAGSRPQTLRLLELTDVLNEGYEPLGLDPLLAYSATDAQLARTQFQRAGFTGSASDAEDASDGTTDGFLGLKHGLAATMSAGFDSDPFLRGTENSSAASIRLQLAPSLSRATERNTFRLTGRLEHIEYLGLYDSLQNVGADLAVSHRATERLEISGNLLFRSNTLATNLSDPFLVDNLAPGDPAQLIGNDITVLGQGQKRTQYGAGAGLSYILSDRDQLSWTLTGQANRFDAGGLVETNSLAQQVQYSRQIDEGLSVGAVVDTSLVDFVNQSGGSAGTITPQLQVRAALSPRVEVTGRVGLAITRRDFGGVEETSTAFAGSLSLCNRGERSNACLNGSRQVLPAAVGGALLQSTVGLSYSYRLSERDTLQLSGNYATASEPSTAFGARDFESINGFARYERQLNERLRVFVSSGYLQTSRNSATDSSNFQALVGVTFDLGQSR